MFDRKAYITGGGDKSEREDDRRVENKPTNDVGDEEKGDRTLITPKRQHNGRMDPFPEGFCVNRSCNEKTTTIRFIQTVRYCLYNNKKGKYDDKTTRVRARSSPYARRSDISSVWRG